MLMDATQIEASVRMDIYELPRRMMDAVARADVDQFVDCFTPDAVWDAQPMLPECRGHDQIRATFNMGQAATSWLLQGYFQSVITAYSADRAQLRSYLIELAVVKGQTEPPPIGIASYLDDLVLTDGRWLVSRHALTQIYYGAQDLTAPIFQGSLRCNV